MNVAEESDASGEGPGTGGHADGETGPRGQREQPEGRGGLLHEFLAEMARVEVEFHHAWAARCGHGYREERIA